MKSPETNAVLSAVSERRRSAVLNRIKDTEKEKLAKDLHNDEQEKVTLSKSMQQSENPLDTFTDAMYSPEAVTKKRNRKEQVEKVVEYLQQEIEEDVRKIEEKADVLAEISESEKDAIEKRDGDVSVIENELKPERTILQTIRENIGGRFAKVAGVLSFIGSLNLVKAESSDDNNQAIIVEEVKDSLAIDQQITVLYEKVLKNPKLFLEHADLFVETIGKDSIAEQVRRISKDQPKLFILNAYRFKNLFPEDLGELVNSAVDSYNAYGKKKNANGESMVKISFNSIPDSIMNHIEDFKTIPGIDMNNLLKKVFNYRSDILVNNIDRLGDIEGFNRADFIKSQDNESDVADIVNNISKIKEIKDIDVSLLISGLLQSHPSAIFDREINGEGLAIIDSFGIDIQKTILQHPMRTVGSDLLERMYEQGLVKSPELKKFYEITKALPYTSENKNAYPGVLINMVLRNNISVEELKTVSSKPSLLFKAFVAASKDSTDPGLKDVEFGLSNMALKEIENINELHEAGEEKRFKSVEGFSPEELCALMVYGEEEVLTSSFRGLFSRMMSKMKKEHQSGNDLLDNLSTNKIVVFTRECVEFGYFDEFLSTMDEAHKQSIIVDIVKSIEGSDQQDDLMENGAVIADIISQLNSQDKMFKILEKEIQSRFAASTQEALMTGYTDEVVAYWTLALLTAEKDKDTTVWPDQFRKLLELPEVNLDLHSLKTKDLFNENNTNIQQYFFYNDDDGKASFASFLSQYENKPGWVVTKHSQFIEINSTGKGKKISIYANYPETGEEGTDTVRSFLDEKMLIPTVIVHRGHSYHTSETIEDVTDKVKLVSLGSCGGYRRVAEVMDKSSEAQILSTKGIGTMLVNDPLFKMLNEKILSDKEIVWSDFWKTVQMRVGRDERFEDYVSPDKNQGLIFFKMYKQVKIAMDKLEQQQEQK